VKGRGGKNKKGKGRGSGGASLITEVLYRCDSMLVFVSDGWLWCASDHRFILNTAMSDMGRTIKTSAATTWTSTVLCQSTTLLWYACYICTEEFYL